MVSESPKSAFSSTFLSTTSAFTLRPHVPTCSQAKSKWHSKHFGSGKRSRAQVNGVNGWRSMQKCGLECGLDYWLAMIGATPEQRRTIAEMYAPRKMHIDEVDRRSKRPEKPEIVPGDEAQWVRQNLNAKGWDKLDPDDYPLLIKHRAVTHTGRAQRTIEPLTQLTFFASAFASNRIEARIDDAMGFGIWVSPGQTLRPGETVVQAVRDARVVDPDCGTLGKGAAWFGPLSCVNSACKRHANAHFKIRGGHPAVVIRQDRKRGVSGGESGKQIFVPYAQGEAGSMKCPVCRTALRDAALDIG